MTEYQKLNRRLQEAVILNSPDILTPKKCNITEINAEDETVSVEVQIGGLITLTGLSYYGTPKVDDEAILIPVYNDYNHSIILCHEKETYTKSEIDELLKNHEHHISQIYTIVETNIVEE